MPNFAVQEICSGITPSPKERRWEEWMGFPAMRMVNGYFPLLYKPGLGFDTDEAKLARLPFGACAISYGPSRVPGSRLMADSDQEETRRLRMRARPISKPVPGIPRERVIRGGV